MSGAAGQREQIVAALQQGRSNAAVAREFAVSVNRVAGIRARTLGPTMSQSDALALGSSVRAAENETKVILAVQKGASTQREIAAALNRRQGTISKIVRRMVRDGLLQRTERRCFSYTVTAQ